MMSNIFNVRVNNRIEITSTVPFKDYDMKKLVEFDATAVIF